MRERNVELLISGSEESEQIKRPRPDFSPQEEFVKIAIS
jgi:hypothetical protein